MPLHLDRPDAPVFPYEGMSAKGARSEGVSLWRNAATSAALFVVDESGRIQHWNEGAERLTGFLEDEVVGKPCYSILCGRHAGRSWCQADCRVRRSALRGALPTGASLEVRSRGGRRIPVAVTFIVQQERGGRLIAHLLEDDARQDQMRQTLRGVLRLLRDLGAPRAGGAAAEVPPPRRSPDRGDAVDFSVLTRREIDVLRLLTEGLSTQAVGERIGVSRLTARNHIQHAVRKLGMHTRTQAVAAALEQGLH